MIHKTVIPLVTYQDIIKVSFPHLALNGILDKIHTAFNTGDDKEDDAQELETILYTVAGFLPFPYLTP